jgi:poly(hydroxyalkanoate) granule-associated protein
MARTRRNTRKSAPLKTWITRTVAAVTDRAAQARSLTTETLSQMEAVFETRVSRAMARLGVPSPAEVRALSREVTRLQQAVEQLRRRGSRA